MIILQGYELTLEQSKPETRRYCLRNKKEKLIPILAIFQLKEELNDA